MPSFYFQQLLQAGLNGIDQQGITAAVLHIAGVVLILSLLWAVYEAYTSGGDVRLLSVAAVKYLVLGLVFLNYQSAFRAVNTIFNGVADGIYNLSGGTDLINAWGNSLSRAWDTNPNWFSALWSWTTGGVSAVIVGLISLVGYLLLPFTYTLFTLFYALYGSILYVVGPFVLALMPSRSLGQVGRSFFVNLMIFQCWGLLYAILQSLMSALEITDPMQFSGSFLRAFVGSSQVIMMSVASVLLSIMIALIPFIASRVVRGDIGGTLMTVISGAVTAGAVASSLAFAGLGSRAAASLLAPEGPPAPPAATPGGISQSIAVVSEGSALRQPQNAGKGASALGESRPPTPFRPETGNSGGGATATAGGRNLSASGDSSSSPRTPWIVQPRQKRGAVRIAKYQDRPGTLLELRRLARVRPHASPAGGSVDGGTTVIYGVTSRTSSHGGCARLVAMLAVASPISQHGQAVHVFSRTMRFTGIRR
jgi:hypothetical protein